MTLYIGQQHPITVYRIVSWVCVVLVLSAHVIISLIEFYFIKILIMIVVTIFWIFIAIHYVLGFLSLSISGSANAQLSGCFRPSEFSLNFGLNMLTSDSFMSCLHSLLGFSQVEFQALQLIFLAAFSAVDKPLASCMLVHFLEI